MWLNQKIFFKWQYRAGAGAGALEPKYGIGQKWSQKGAGSENK